MPRDLQRAHSLFCLHDETNRHEPKFQRQVRRIEYRSGLRGELIAKALLAFIHAAEQTASGDVLAILATAGLDAHFGDVLLSTFDAAHAVRPAQTDEMIDALIFRLEFCDNVYRV